jgi:rRNA-processing protein FCF1
LEKIKVMLDTNFLLTMIRYKIHGFEDIKQKLPVEFYTLSRVLVELKGLEKSDKKVKKEVAIVEQVLKNNNVKVIDSTSEDVDSELVKLSSKGYVIATNDKFLRQRIKQSGGKTIFIRSLTYIDTGDVIDN